MATPAQIEANRKNARRSTGPRTPEGKAAVAKNRTTHGLTGTFAMLACEDRAAYEQMLDEYMREYNPRTPTARFFVNELAQAQWRLMRADAMEAEILNPGDNPTYAAAAASLRDSDALSRLGRYAQAARRAYYKAQEKLEALQANTVRQRREDRREEYRRWNDYLEAPLPTKDKPVPVPIPPAIERELDDLLDRNPGFDPNDTSEMSDTLRRWFDGMKPRTE